MKKQTIKGISLIISFVLILCCAGCGKKTSKQAEISTQATLPEQKKMSQDALASAMEYTEYQMVASALATEDQEKCLDTEWGSKNHTQTYLGDIDQDGHPELLHGMNAICFDMNGDDKGINFAEGTGIYAGGGLKDIYITNMGMYYTHLFHFDDLQVVVNGQVRYYEGTITYYDPLWGNTDSFLMRKTDSYKLSEDYTEQYFEPESDEDILYYREINGQEVSADEWATYFEKNGIYKLTKKADEYTAYEYDAIYHDSIVNTLNNLFQEKYSGYRGMYTKDLNGDGLEEHLFLVTDYMTPWFENLHIPNNGAFFDPEMGIHLVNESLDTKQDRTALVIVQANGDKVQVKACSTFGNITQLDKENISYKNSHLIVGDKAIYMPAKMEDEQAILMGIEQYLSDNGFQNIFMKYDEIAESESEELFCISKKDGKWNIMIFVFLDGVPSLIYRHQLDNQACFLTKSKDQPAILLYKQNVTKNSQGIFENTYSYEVHSLEIDGLAHVLDVQYFTYDENVESAAQTSDFFAKLNQYLTNISVVYDPFSLSGEMWMNAEEVVYGELPVKKEEQKEETSTEQLGFVEIEDTNSWLHLRVGPGMQYDKVLIDSTDTDSFIRQADGSPVTILETIKSDDPSNPEWVKIRIRYHGKDIVGYSSKKYIRLAE